MLWFISLYFISLVALTILSVMYVRKRLNLNKNEKPIEYSSISLVPTIKDLS